MSWRFCTYKKAQNLCPMSIDFKILQDICMDIHPNKSVDYCQASVKWELGDLRSRKFTICVSELDDGFVVPSRVSISAHTVESCFLHGVVDCGRIIQVDCLSYNCEFGLARVRGKDEGANIARLAELVIDTLFVANGFLLL